VYSGSVIFERFEADTSAFCRQSSSFRGDWSRARIAVSAVAQMDVLTAVSARTYFLQAMHCSSVCRRSGAWRLY